MLEYILVTKELVRTNVLARDGASKKYYFVKKKSDFHIEIPSIVTEFITVLRLYNFVDMMQSVIGIVSWYNLLCLENIYDEKIGNLELSR